MARVKIDGLVESGELALNSLFDANKFGNWSMEALDCLTKLLGANHYYTNKLGYFVLDTSRINLLAAYGIMSAVQQQLDDL